jgi:hypothetical protein
LAATSNLSKFLQKARTRFLIGLFLDQAAISALVGAVGVILLLLVGTQLLDWYWPAILFAASLLVGVLRTRRGLLSRYSLAQVVDRRLGLHDGISTSIYFRESGQPVPEAVDTVEHQVIARLRDEDVVRAVPIRVPRSVYAMSAVLLMAGGMLALRYGLTQSLDLRPPLARFDFNFFESTPPVEAAARKSEIQERFDQQLKQLGLSLEDLESPESRGEKPVEETVQTLPAPDGDQADAEGGQRTGEKGAPEGTEPGDGSENTELSTGADKTDPGDSETAAASQGKENSAPKEGKSGSRGSQENSGLMNKMRDALANLMNKLKTPSRGESQQQASSDKSGQEGAARQDSKQSGMQAQGRSQSEGQPSPDQAGDQPGDGDNLAANQPKAGDKSADQPGSEDAKSGMGKQDGSKDITDAEQLAAMGKISEIFGKRASQISGEITVEVPSGRQQLKTDYSDKKALHADVGGEVNRDEIPLMYQPYIQRYFEEVRKMRSKVKN